MGGGEYAAMIVMGGGPKGGDPAARGKEVWDPAAEMTSIGVERWRQDRGGGGGQDDLAYPSLIPSTSWSLYR